MSLSDKIKQFDWLVAYETAIFGAIGYREFTGLLHCKLLQVQKMPKLNIINLVSVDDIPLKRVLCKKFQLLKLCVWCIK